MANGDGGDGDGGIGGQAAAAGYGNVGGQGATVGFGSGVGGTDAGQGFGYGFGGLGGSIGSVSSVSGYGGGGGNAGSVGHGGSSSTDGGSGASSGVSGFGSGTTGYGGVSTGSNAGGRGSGGSSGIGGTSGLSGGESGGNGINGLNPGYFGPHGAVTSLSPLSGDQLSGVNFLSLLGTLSSVSPQVYYGAGAGESATPAFNGVDSNTLANMVQTLESGPGGINAANQPKGMVSPQYGQYPGFAKEFGLGAAGLNNYASAILAAHPNATLGDLYSGYVLGTGSAAAPAFHTFGELQATHVPGAQGAATNFSNNAGFPANTPLAPFLTGASPSQAAQDYYSGGKGTATEGVNALGPTGAGVIGTSGAGEGINAIAPTNITPGPGVTTAPIGVKGTNTEGVNNLAPLGLPAGIKSVVVAPR